MNLDQSEKNKINSQLEIYTKRILANSPPALVECSAIRAEKEESQAKAIDEGVNTGIVPVFEHLFPVSHFMKYT